MGDRRLPRRDHDTNNDDKDSDGTPLPEEVNETDGVFANGLTSHETNDAAEPLTNGQISSNDEDSALLDKIDCFKTVRVRSFHSFEN